MEFFNPMASATVVDELSYFSPDAAFLFVFKDRFMAFLPLLDTGAVKTDRKVEYGPLGLSVHSDDLPDRTLHQTFPAQPHYMW